MKKTGPTLGAMKKALQELGRVAGALLDGEEACRVITDRAWHYVANPDPKYRFLAGDYFDVEFDGFLRIKKLLLRMEKLVDFPCNATIWLKVRGRNDSVTILLHNGTVSRWYEFGKATIPVPVDMARCLRSGRVTLLGPDARHETVTVIAPVRDSLGDVVGLAEFSALSPKARRLAPACS